MMWFTLRSVDDSEVSEVREVRWGQWVPPSSLGSAVLAVGTSASSGVCGARPHPPQEPLFSRIQVLPSTGDQRAAGRHSGQELLPRANQAAASGACQREPSKSWRTPAGGAEGSDPQGDGGDDLITWPCQPATGWLSGQEVTRGHQGSMRGHQEVTKGNQGSPGFNIRLPGVTARGQQRVARGQKGSEGDIEVTTHC